MNLNCGVRGAEGWGQRGRESEKKGGGRDRERQGGRGADLLLTGVEAVRWIICTYPAASPTRHVAMALHEGCPTPAQPRLLYTQSGASDKHREHKGDN
jgi:hypothetical protein